MASRRPLVQQLLLTWFARNRRSLPWRTDRSPYYVVVSEFMLQQTQVERVVPAFERFVAEFPSFAALAGARTDAVVRAWRGLGYNTRAVRLQRLARVVCERHGGILPSDAASLRELPGIGPYTVGAIRAFAFDRDDIALDTNVRRVIHRVAFGIEWPPAPRNQLDAAVARFVLPGCGNDTNSALMDLGASICTARAPKCLVCPLRSVCSAAPVDPVRLAALARAHAAWARPHERMPFQRTTRFLRGRIVDVLRALPQTEAISLADLHGEIAALVPDKTAEDVKRAANALVREGIAAFAGVSLMLARDAGAAQPNQDGRSE
jgi:A/G-specific adenine glycosylase